MRAMDIYLHSYTFRAHPFETAVQYARRYGYDGVELSLVHCRDSELRDDLDNSIRTANRYGMAIACVDFRGNFIADSEREVYQSVGLVEKRIELCGDKGIRRLNGFAGVLAKEGAPFGESGSALAIDDHYQRAADALRYLGDVAEKHDVLLTLEIHMNTPHDTIASMRRLLEQTGHARVAANPDPGNMFATSTAERDPAALDAIGSQIAYFHFKNCAARAGTFDFSVPLSCGHVDTFGWLAKLRDLDYAGPVCIEYVGEGDPRAAARNDIAYLRECIQLLDDGLA